MLNKMAKKSVLMCSLVWLTAPLSGTVYAQNNTTSSQMLFEMQAMRAEIADLRDMVERQQFELKKLKQRNIELESVQQQSQANVEAQILQLQQSRRLAQPNIDYNNPYGNNPYGTYADQQVGAVVGGENLQNTPAGEFSGNSTTMTRSSQGSGKSNDTAVLARPNLVSPQNVDGRSPIDQLDQQRVMSATDENTSGSIGETAQEPALTTIDQAQTQVNQGPEIVERGFDSADLNRPVSQGGLTGQDSEFSQQGAIAQQATTGQQSTVGQEDARVLNAAPKNTSSPILSVPNLDADSTDTATPIDAGQTPAAPVDTVAEVNQVVESPKPVQLSEDQHYDQGFEYLKQSKYDEAISTFNQQIALYPKGDLADDAHYWVAEAYLINRRSAEAKPHLKAIIDNYPTSARLPDAMLKTAYIEQDLGNLIEARILLQEIVARHPSSNAAIAARNRLENLRSL